jgi:hypothetical protein
MTRAKGSEKRKEQRRAVQPVCQVSNHPHLIYINCILRPTDSVILIHTDDTAAPTDMSRIPDDPDVPLDAAALIEYQALQAENDAGDDIEGDDVQDVVDETPLGDVEVQELHEQDYVVEDGEPVIVPDETTAEADEHDAEAEGPVPADLEDAVADTALDPEATLAPEDDAGEAGPGEVAGADDADDGVDDGTADDYADAAGNDGEGEGEGEYEASEAADGDYGVDQMADELEKEAIAQLERERDSDGPEAGLAMAYHDGVAGEDAIREVAGDAADDIVRAEAEPVDEVASQYSMSLTCTDCENWRD